MNGTSKRKPSGFTLVEILVVIVIIGILMGLAVPAIFGAIGTAKSTKMRLEVGALEDAIERYQQKYGDYPPDFSDWTIVERHYRKIFPRIQKSELDLFKNELFKLKAYESSLKINTLAAKSLHWCLAGYSSNPLQPFTGPGGPLERVNNAPALNMTRENALYDFDPARLDFDPEAKKLGRYQPRDGFVFFSYLASEDGAPFVHFDSRTYRYNDSLLGYNGYFAGLESGFGAVRPYLSDIVNNQTGVPEFAKPTTFQIIAPGIDGNFGFTSWADVSSSPTGFGTGNHDNSGDVQLNAVYFQYPTGKAFGALSFTIPEISRYQEPIILNAVDNFQQDNLTNFASAKLIDELEE